MGQSEFYVQVGINADNGPESFASALSLFMMIDEYDPRSKLVKTIKSPERNYLIFSFDANPDIFIENVSSMDGIRSVERLTEVPEGVTV